jgi:arginyl-tRNA synthetase
MIRAKEELLIALSQALGELAPGTTLLPAFETPKQASHGDLACTLAMQLARPLKKNPRELAQALIEALQRQPAVQRWVAALEIAGPGFINLRLQSAAKQAVVGEVLGGGEGFGRRAANGRKLMVEFVSANPTGPLHVGHARQGALGDSLCHLFETQGFEVLREFYYNDAGVQIATLATSTQCRIQGLKPGDDGWPESAYNGDYIADIAADFLAKKTVQSDDRTFTGTGDPDDLEAIRQFRGGLPAQRAGPAICRPSACVSTTITSNRQPVQRWPGRAGGAAPREGGQDLRGRRRPVAAHHRLR